MKLIVASDSFKGSLSSKQANDILECAAKEVFQDCQCHKLLIADGGEGTLEAIMGDKNENAYQKVAVSVTGPLGEKIKTFYIRKGNQAIVEMAAASGLTLVQREKRNPLHTTTKGTGELICHALKSGCRDIYIAIGGSATNDGGTGAMEALGFRFLDKNKQELPGIGANLKKIASIDDSGCMEEINKARFTVMCDVVNTLTGPTGATFVYGPQKGGTEDILKELEFGMLNYQNVLQKYWGKKIAAVPGLGAAGGLGAALYVFLSAEMKSGIDVLLDLHGFDVLLKKADLIVTGEGKTDEQSVNGKVIYGIARRCKKAKKSLYVISGCVEGKLDTLYDSGVTQIESAMRGNMTIEEAMKNAEQNLYRAAVKVFQGLKKNHIGT